MNAPRWLWSVLPLLALVGCDHATKWVAKSELEGQPPRPVIGQWLDLRYAENTDIAFNLLRWIPDGARAPLLLVTGALAIAVLAVLLARSPVVRARAAGRFAAVLVLAGALGNYTDRLGRGYVVDFIHVPYWPVFNVADICLTIGLVLLVWVNLRATAPPALRGAGPAP